MDYLNWVLKEKPDAGIALEYENRAGRLFDPRGLDKRISLWTYDPDDAEKYGMNLNRIGFFEILRPPAKTEKSIDILYVGRDKGRADKIFDLQRRLEKSGLKTYVRICPDRSYMLLKKKYYKPVITYQEYLQLLSQSRAIVNIMPENQRSITWRDLEVCYYGVKEITNNRWIKDSELYDKSRYFILGEDDLDGISDFLDTPSVPVDEEVLVRYSFENNTEYILDKI